jgi:integrase
MKGRSKSRSMPLHPAVQESIKSWLFVYLPGLPNALQRPLFPRQRTCFPLTRSQAFNIITRAAAKAGIDVNRVSCHSCRKTFARKLWGSEKVGFDIAKMARLLGHQNVRNTLTYLEFGRELDAAVMSL